MLAEREEAWLDPRATRSNQTRGREIEEGPDAVRTEFQRDRDRIIHAKAFRRLKHKTQVFVSPERDHYRTRLTHTLEVAQIARTVARALRLNEDLVEAIGIGHDLGHAPFGHVGEEALDEAYAHFVPGARFRHYEQSLRIVDELENNGRGLNLTWEVRDGILRHSKGKSDLMATNRHLPATLEGQVVRICDRIAYVNHDIDDAVRAGLIRAENLPHECLEVLGRRHSERITTMVLAVIGSSSDVVREGEQKRQSTLRLVHEEITMHRDIMEATDRLKNWMFENVYKLESVDETPRVRRVIGALFERFMEQPQLMRGDYAELCSGDGSTWSTEQRARCVCDYIAGMTDRFASQIYAQLFMPSSWRGV
ncbi:MAG: dGTPase [Abditibacteriota bacterium]|nr:dGTPase [Abditibacteriota bacterium]